MEDVTFRFIEVYNRILSDGIVSGAKDFAHKLDISSSMMTEIVKGRSNIGLKGIQNIVLRFNVNSEWLFTGKGNMLIVSDQVSSLVHSAEKSNQGRIGSPGCERCKIKDELIESLRQTIESTRLTIDAQTKLISHLEENKSSIEEGQKRKVV